MSTIDLGKIKFVWRGAYNNSTAYTPDDVVSSGGSSYICILASTGNAVSNGTYWSLLAQGGDVATTLNAQGDILYRDGSGIAKLAAGTSGQFLKTQGTGANPTWGTVSQGGLKQTVFTTVSTTFSSAADTWVATPLSITITPTSSSSKIVLFMRTHINTTGDTYPRFKWYRKIGSGAFSSIITEPTNPNGGNSQGTYLGDRADSTNQFQMNTMSDVYQDYPNTTSAVIYTLYGHRENGGTYYINTSEHQEAGNTNDYNQVGISTLLAMETGV